MGHGEFDDLDHGQHRIRAGLGCDLGFTFATQESPLPTESSRQFFNLYL